MIKSRQTVRHSGQTLLVIIVGAIFCGSVSCAEINDIAVESGGHYVWRSVPWSVLEMSMPTPIRGSVVSVKARVDSVGHFVSLMLLIPGHGDLEIPEAITRRLEYPLLHTLRVFYPEPVPVTGQVPIQLMVDFRHAKVRKGGMCPGRGSIMADPSAEIFVDLSKNEIVTLIRDECEELEDEFTTPVPTE